MNGITPEDWLQTASEHYSQDQFDAAAACTAMGVLSLLIGGAKVLADMTNGEPSDELVHVLVLKAFIGQPEPGQECCHNDGNPANNALTNLRWDTRSENNLDCVRHGTHHQTRKTHCPHGHEYSPENTYTNAGRKQRLCRTCRRIRNREYQRKRLQRECA